MRTNSQYSPLNTDPQGPGWSVNALVGLVIATAHFGVIFWLTFVARIFYYYGIEKWHWTPVGIAGYLLFMGWRDIKVDHKQGELLVILGSLLMAASVVISLSQYFWAW